eukprot:TCONS_00062731-protein
MLSGAFYGSDAHYRTTKFTSSTINHVDKLNNVENEEVIFCSLLDTNGKEVKAYLTSKRFIWDVTFIHPTTRKPKTIHHDVELNNIIIAQYERGFHKKAPQNEIELFPTQYFSVHYCRKIKGNKLKHHHVVFQAKESEICKSWVDSIKSTIKRYTSRPEKLLVFINPVGGKKEAEKIFQSKVEPLFYLAKVNYDIVITERMNHAKDYLCEEDISSYDGVISVGGDGMFSEVMNGVLKYEEEQHQIITSSRTNKPIIMGIIPAGSTDTVIYCTTGCNDPVTAALQIVLGDELPMDVCSVWHDDDLFKYSISLMAYGYFGDIIRESEKLRWIGPKRYDFAGFKRFMVNKSYEGEVTFRSANPPQIISAQQEQCKQGCKRCSTFVDDEDTQGEWQTISGRFISVLAANISCRCAKSSTGISPHAHIGDGEIDLILVRKTTRANYLHHLIKISEKTTDNFDFSFIEVHRVKEFRFRPLNSTSITMSELENRADISPINTRKNGEKSDNGTENEKIFTIFDDRKTTLEVPDHDYIRLRTLNGSRNSLSSNSSTSSDTSVWNVDGELVEYPELHFKVHRQLIRVYARGIEDD